MRPLERIIHVIILEAIAYKVNGGIQIRSALAWASKSALTPAPTVLGQFAESHLANGRFDAVNCPKTAAAPGHFTTLTFS